MQNKTQSEGSRLTAPGLWETSRTVAPSYLRRLAPASPHCYRAAPSWVNSGMPHAFSVAFRKTEAYLGDEVPTNFVNNWKGQTLPFGVWKKPPQYIGKCRLWSKSVLSSRCQSQRTCLGGFCKGNCIIKAFCLVLKFRCVSQTQNLQGVFSFFFFPFLRIDVLNNVTCKIGINKISVLILACNRNDIFWFNLFVQLAWF